VLHLFFELVATEFTLRVSVRRRTCRCKLRANARAPCAAPDAPTGISHTFPRFSVTQTVVALWMHELAHSATAAFVALCLWVLGASFPDAQRSAKQALCSANLRGNVPLSVWAACVLPSSSGIGAFMGLGGLRQGPFVYWVPPKGEPAPAAQALVRAAGPAGSLALALAVTKAVMAGGYLSQPVSIAAVAAPWLVLAAGCASDLAPASSGLAAFIFRCGNFGCILNLANGTRFCLPSEGASPEPTLTSPLTPRSQASLPTTSTMARRSWSACAQSRRFAAARRLASPP